MNLHKALLKQIDKFFPDNIKDDERFLPFLESISKMYSLYEKDKKMSEHAFEISEKEYQSVLFDLNRQDEIQKESIQRIKSLMCLIESENQANQEDDLSTILIKLEDWAGKSKQLEEMLILAKERAENMALAKSNFLSIMSHEIRTPLNAIIGSIHILKQEAHLQSQILYINSLQVSADNLLNLVNDILDFNKIEEGKVIFAKRDLNLRALLNNIKLSNQFKANEVGNKIKLMVDDDIPNIVKGDDTRLSQILNNIISNAIKFTSNGIINFDVLLDEENDESVTIQFSIKDNGIGISTDNLLNIFERFTQADSNVNRTYGGSGLGLSIVKKLLELQHSTIYVESELGKGSRFYFSLKFDKALDNSVQEELHESSTKDLSGLKILLVEDVEFNVMIAKAMLASWNADVDVALNGKIALDMFTEGKYDLILMDLQMPVMDGITATQEIRKLGSQIPIIALTASASFDVQSKVKDSGMSGYVAKPFNPDDLYNSIKPFMV